MVDTSVSKSGSAGLVVFGVLQILVGLACGLLVLFIASGSEIAVRQGPGGGAALASGLIVWGVASVYFVSVGIGSMKRRRWAQALSVVVSAMWLAAGFVATLMLIVLLPTLEQRAHASGVAIIGATILLAIALPLAILLFYRSDSVRALCAASDIPRWTDRVPLPVLAVMIVLGFGALALVASLANPQISMFGSTVTGAPAAVTLLGLSILSAWLAVQFYRLRESAWWTLVLLQVIGCVIATVSLVRGGTTSPDDVARSPFFVAIIVGTWLAYFAYLLFIRRYFALNAEPRTRRDDVAPRVT